MTNPNSIGARPAYPFPADHTTNGNNGMTMRQFYKAAALQGLISNPATYCSIARLTKAACEIADAMLAEDAAHEKGEGA